MAKRIYTVIDRSDQGAYLVRANSPAGAIGRITNNRYYACIASQEQIVELVGLGAPVIDVDDVLELEGDGLGSTDEEQSSLDLDGSVEQTCDAAVHEAAHVAQAAERHALAA